MKTASLIYCLLAMLSFLTIGCSDTMSSNVKTSGISINWEVKGDSLVSATCTAQFQVGGSTGTFLDLDGGDKIECEGRPMVRSEFFGIITYSVNVPYSVGYNYKITFTRPNEPAYVGTVTLPNAAVPLSPAPNTTVKKGSFLIVSWVPSNSNQDTMSLRLSFTAVSAGNTQTTFNSYLYDGPTETGMKSFSPLQTSPIVSAGSWPGQVEFQRYRYGQVPSGLKGSIRAIQTWANPITLIDQGLLASFKLKTRVQNIFCFSKRRTPIIEA